MIYSMLACLAALAALLWMLRAERLSLGLPFAYLASLLLIHVPGAFAHWVGESMLDGGEYVVIGIRYTAIGAVCFVAGVWLARRAVPIRARPGPADRADFARFCLIGGWVFVYGLTALARVPSLGAVIDTGGSIWMLGVLMGLRSALLSGNVQRAVLWGGALAVYPAFMLLLGGFLSYGAAAVIVVISVLVVFARSYLRATIGVAFAALVGLTVFVNYFDHRADIRESVWGGEAMGSRLSAVSGVFTDFHLIDLGSEKDLLALDQRLNQNMFVGLAATRIGEGQVDYLNGKSVTDGLLSLIPRALWPDKPVTGGSGQIVADMTGLSLNEDTSWGVGNVMEFYINFGVPGLVVGFLALGGMIGFLDIRGAAAERRGDLGQMPLYFLPAVALIQPGASLVEISGSAGAALVAAFGWRWLWTMRMAGQARRAATTRAIAPRLPQSGVGPAE
ncbi:MAG TPA: hypothetical protein VMT68_02325 [Caulobacteraceae bacterium]|nr:hypothetical protein [Caulobacteraceae bacterium]